LLLGSAFLVVPGVGHLVIAGPFLAALLGGLEGAAVGGSLSVLGAALYSLGIPEDSVIHYETAVKANKFIVIAHGSHEEVEKAREVLSSHNGRDIQSFTNSSPSL